jgi:rubredoxin
MPESMRCPRCQGMMQDGHIPDSTYGGFISQNWVEGAFTRSFWGAFKRVPKFAVVTYRCAACGFLESYAPANGA